MFVVVTVLIFVF